MSTRGLLRAAGLLTWAFAGIPAATSIATETSCSSVGGVASIAAWVGAFAVFGLTFFRATREESNVHLVAPESLDVSDPEHANTLVRCVQEIVTNTIKHAAAENLWITVERHNGCIEVKARDDGRGAPSIVPGNGLEGMRERMTALGGDLVLETNDGEGFRVRAVLPIARELGT